MSSSIESERCGCKGCARARLEGRQDLLEEQSNQIRGFFCEKCSTWWKDIHSRTHEQMHEKAQQWKN